MSAEYAAACNKCGKKFTLLMGGGFFFHLLRCDRCGRVKSVGFDEIGELRSWHLKGQGGVHSAASGLAAADARENCPGEPLADEEYYAAVENTAGGCGCGGKFKFDAPPRCPKCRSTDIRKGEVLALYD